MPNRDRAITAPSYVLSGLPAGTGGAALQDYVYSTLSAKGIDIGVSLADISHSVHQTTQ